MFGLFLFGFFQKTTKVINTKKLQTQCKEKIDIITKFISLTKDEKSLKKLDSHLDEMISLLNEHQGLTAELVVVEAPTLLNEQVTIIDKIDMFYYNLVLNERHIHPYFTSCYYY